MRNTKQTFLFSFRGTPSEKRVTQFLKHYGFEFAHIDNSAYVSKKELGYTNIKLELCYNILMYRSVNRSIYIYIYI